MKIKAKNIDSKVTEHFDCLSKSFLTAKTKFARLKADNTLFLKQQYFILQAKMKEKVKT